MNGKLIVFEGLDCSGKTTLINDILKENNEKAVYSKGIGSDSWMGKLAKRLHCTFVFYIELWYNIILNIFPALRKGKIILQDRYNISIDSYIPLVKRWYNRMIILIFRTFLPKPDILIYLTLPLEERIKRLKEKNTKYEILLAKNPLLILKREAEYGLYYNSFKGMKIKIDTQANDIRGAKNKASRFIFQ
jgi:thymidylate kinase